MKMKHLCLGIIIAIVFGFFKTGWTQGNLTGINVDASSSVAGATAIYRFTFTTGAGNDTISGIPADGKIEFHFPATFDVSSVDIVSSQNSNLTGGFLVPQINGQVVTVTRDSTGNDVAAGTSVTISLGVVTNSTVAGFYSFAIITKTASGDSIDSGQFNGFAISEGALDHFQIAISGNATAGQNYSVTITARDAFDNLVQSHTAAVSLLDETGTISPTTSGAFTAGSVTLNVTFQKSMTGNKITAVYNNKSGESNTFDVLPAALHHFSFDEIASPKTAGSAFLISITAHDQYENQVTNFVDKVQLTDLSGSLNVQTPNFSNGRLENYSITITTSKTDNAITAVYQASGQSGQSNFFNVQAGNLAKFYISNITSPQTAGQYFTVTIVAQDNWNNTVSDFASKVTITDLSGTVTPVESGSFVGGQWTGNLMVRSAYTGNKITVTKFAGSETGTSNVFDVVPGALDHFSISAINSPQTAGNAFNVTIQAQDDQNNLIETYVDKVTLTDLTNTISPQQTDNFTSGQWTGSITITKSTANNKIFISGNGKSGESNSFVVQANSLHHFSFSTINGTQTAGTQFSITVNANDQYENLVESFNDNITLSDITGTISPTSMSLANGTGSANVTIYQSVQNNKISASHASSGKTGSSNSFNVSPAEVQSIVIRNNPGGLGTEVGDLNLNLGDEIQLYAAGYDQWGNYVREVFATWSNTGNLDLPSPLTGTSTLFRAETPLTSGKIHADSVGLIDDYTGTFTVGSIAAIKIVDRAGGLGKEISNLTITADDSLTLYAAAFDAKDNYIGLVEVQWTSDGTLKPPVFFTDSVFVFNPTRSGTSGHILADYNGSLQATTGVISVIPGAPFGRIELHPDTSIIAAHPDSFTIIISDKVVDSDGNYVGEGKYFIVSTTAGTITTPDEKPDLDGHWISTNSYSRLYFQLNGDSNGGNALVSVHSAGEGNAFGDTTVIISGLEIVSVEVAADKATQGQKNIPVNMVVANRGTIDISLNAAGLEFWGPGFDLLTNKFSITRIDTISTIVGQTQEILSFQIDVLNDTPAELVTVDGYVVGVLNNKIVRDDSASAVDQILIQTEPNLVLENIATYVDTVIQGTSTTVSATVRNSGDATAIIQTDSLIFWAKNLNINVTPEYAQDPFPSNSDKIDGHSAVILNYAVSAGTNATIDTIAIAGKIVAVDENTGDLANFNSFEPEYDGWWVHQASDVEIIDFKPSQFTVTRGQTGDWTLMMAIENRGGIDLVLDSATVKFTLGGSDISDEYQILKPTKFENSNDDTLRPGSVDTLIITVDETGTSLGIVTVEGLVYLNDKISGQIVKSTATGITVQSEAEVVVDFIHLSQSEVTTGQTMPWDITIGITNNGGGDVAIDTTRLNEFVTFGNDTSYKLTLPEHFLGSSNWTLPSGDSDSLLFSVDTTGIKTGIRNLFVNVFVREINSQRLITAQDTVQFLVETPPAVKILQVENIAPNAPFVDISQQFQVAVILKNDGGDAAKKVFISLTSDSASTISNPVEIVQNLQSADIDTAIFSVTAFGGEVVEEIFTAKIDSIVSENTPEPDKAVILPAVDSTAIASIQAPAVVKIDSFYTENDTTKALSRNAWHFYLDVRNSGKAELIFNKPDVSDVGFYIGGEKQEDYTVQPPENLEQGGDLNLPGGESDRFVFTITKNGFKGGEAKIAVQLKGTYLNSNQAFEISDSTTIFVQPSADIYVDLTEPVCPNVNDFGIGQINLNQQFWVRAKIRNSGAEQVDNVIVKLTSQSQNVPARYDTIESIMSNSDSMAIFQVDSINVSGQEIFTAKILSAMAHESQVPAIIGPASDSTAFVMVHTPAYLKIEVLSYDAIFTAGQVGRLKLRVDNLGTAEVDSSGKLYVQVPDGYGIVKGQSLVLKDTTNFAVGDTLNFDIQPPQDISDNDTIRIVLFKPSLDKNIQLPAMVKNPFENLAVKTVPSSILIQTFQITSPAGALDDTLSTEQSFVVKLQVLASENLSSLTASLRLPQGFGFAIGEDSVKTLPRKTAQWNLIAPNTPTATAQWIKVNVSGKSDGQTEVIADSFRVFVVPRAILVFEDVWVSWPPQTVSTFSAGQEFDLSVLVKSKNVNQAKVTGLAALRVNFGSTGITTKESLIKSFKVDSTIVWRLKAPEVETGKRPLTIYMENIPDDENTSAPAEIWSGQTRVDFYVQTVESGNIKINEFRIASPSGATDEILSTRQNFLLETQLEWKNCAEPPTVTLKLPEGFTTAENNPKQPASQTGLGTVTWNVRAPEVSGSNLPLWLDIQAIDINSGSQISLVSDSIKVEVVDRAEIQLNGEILAPLSAKDNIVSPGEEFTIAAYLTFSGTAQATGNFTATITLPQSRDYTVTGSRTKTVKADQWITWSVRAPLTKQDPANILIELTAPPDDENTNEPIALEAISSDVVAIPITTEEKSVSISVLPQPGENTQARGGTNVTLLRLKFDVSGDGLSNNVILSGVKLKLKNRFGQLIENPGSVLTRLAVVDGNNHNVVFANVTNLPSENPIRLNFTNPDSLKPLEENIIDFVADIAGNTTVGDFYLAIDSTNAITMYIAGSGIVPEIRTDSGESGQVLGLQSQTTVLVDADIKKSFSNYPNPFGSPERPETKFVYYLDADTDVTIAIYTLIGELVWKVSYSAAEPQGRRGLHNGDVTWDGRNNNGKRVLNGVYAARIATGNGKEAITKIVVVK